MKTSRKGRAIVVAVARGLALALLCSVSLDARAAVKPEDVFKGKIMITASRLPMKFASPGAFIAAVNRAKTDKIWPKEEKGNDHAVWSLDYIAFFAQPLNDNEVQLKFFEITGGTHRFVAGDQQYTREKATRVFASNITVQKPDFDTNHKYMMTLESGRRILATATFWLRGKGPNYSGKVEFSNEEAKQR